MASFDDTLKQAVKQAAATDPLRAYQAAGYSGELKPSSGNLVGLCPFHTETDGSFKITLRPHGKVEAGHWECFGACKEGGDVIAFVEKLHGLTFPAALERLGRDLGIEAAKASPKQAKRQIGPTKRYGLCDVDGRMIATHLRKDFDDGSKDCPYLKPDGMELTALPLYGTEKLKGLEDGARVVVTEGEKDCESLWARGLAAVGTACSSTNTPCDDSLRPLLRFAVVLWPDADGVGAKHMHGIAARMQDLGNAPGLVAWADAPKQGAGADDFKGDSAAIESLLVAAQLWQPGMAADEARSRAKGVLKITAQDLADPDMPLTVALAKAHERLRAVEEQLPGTNTQRRVKLTTHADLAAMVLPSVRWAVPGLLPEGLAVLAGKPKAGKSYLALQIACAVGTGGQVFGKPVELGQVLYVALEDGVRRRQSRANEQMWPADAQVDWADDLPTFGDGGLTELAALLQGNDYQLCVIDTIGRFLGAGDFNDYAQMTSAFGELQTLAGQTATTLLCIAHHHKAAAGDPVADLLGSTGQSGAADTLMGLYRGQRGEASWHLRVVSRECDEMEMELRRDNLTKTWLLAPGSGGVTPGSVQEQLLATLDDMPDGATTTQLSSWIGRDRGNVSAELHELQAKGLVVVTGGRPAVYQRARQ